MGARIDITDKRKRAYKRGLWSETLAALWLMLQGYRILKRRYKTPYGEIDLVACRGPMLAMVEVKARPDLTQGLESVTRHQQQRIEQAVLMFLQENPAYAQHALRLDVMVCRPWRWPHHLKDAWRPES